MTEAFKRDIAYAAKCILLKNIDTIACRLSEGYNPEQIIGEVLKKEHTTPDFDLLKIEDLFSETGETVFVPLNGFMQEGGMAFMDIRASLMSHAVNVVKDNIKRVLMDVTACIKDTNIDRIIMVLNYRMEQKFPTALFKANEKAWKPKMLGNWLDNANDVFPEKEAVFIGQCLDELYDSPLTNILCNNRYKDFIKVDRDLATFFPELVGLVYENVRFAYQLMRDFDCLAEAPKATRIEAASQCIALDELVNDSDADVRLAVARQGYGLDLLISDSEDAVKAASKAYLKAYNLSLLQWTDANPDKWASHKKHEAKQEERVDLQSKSQESVLSLK